MAMKVDYPIIRPKDRDAHPSWKPVSELKKMRLTPQDKLKPVAYVRRHGYPSYYLYDKDTAVAYVRTEEEREKDRGLRERRKAQRRHFVCFGCKEYVGAAAYNFINEHQHGLCDSCLKKAERNYDLIINGALKQPLNFFDTSAWSVSDVIAIDLETTGLSPLFDEILSVAIVDGDGSVLLSSKLCPLKFKKWDSAETVNGLCYEQLRSYPTIDKLIPQINYLVQNAKKVIGYNTSFDVSFIRALGIPTNHLALVDVMEYYSNYYGEIDYVRACIKWKSLSFAAAQMGYLLENAHDAKADILATIFIWKKLCHLMESGDYQRVVEHNMDLLNDYIAEKEASDYGGNY